MKFSTKFENDYAWFLSVLTFFDFDGKKDYFDKKGNEIIVFAENGVSAKESFYYYDSQGKIVPTCEVDLLQQLHKTKGSINLHIKMYAEDRASGVLPKCDFLEIVEQIKAPQWFIEAVEAQKYKHYSELPLL